MNEPGKHDATTRDGHEIKFSMVRMDVDDSGTKANESGGDETIISMFSNLDSRQVAVVAMIGVITGVHHGHALPDGEASARTIINCLLMLGVAPDEFKEACKLHEMMALHEYRKTHPDDIDGLPILKLPIDWDAIKEDGV